jgi:hypothetical protein
MHHKERATGQVDQDISWSPLSFIANAKFPTNSAKIHVPLHATHAAFPTLATKLQLKSSLLKTIKFHHAAIQTYNSVQVLKLFPVTEN